MMIVITRIFQHVVYFIDLLLLIVVFVVVVVFNTMERIDI